MSATVRRGWACASLLLLAPLLARRQSMRMATICC